MAKKKNDPLRPTPGTTVTSPWGNKVEVVRVAETQEFINVHWKKLAASSGSDKGIIKHRKYLCLGGKLEGQWLTKDEATGYEMYNRNSGWVDGPSAILIDQALLASYAVVDPKKVKGKSYL